MTEPDDAPPETLQEYFVVQLRRFRHDRGLSQTQLAERINFSPGLISMVETLQRNPTADFTAACDAALDTGGALSALLPMLAREAYPTWFRSFAALEAEAVGIEDFEVQLVPGLLQTEDYARAVFELAWPLPSDDEINQMLQARMERQYILDRAVPPTYWAVLDESVLIRRVGTAQTMAGQLAHMIGLAERPNVLLQILPIDRAGRAPLDGSFVVLQLERNERLAYTEGLGSGKLLPEPRDVDRAARALNVVRSEALSARESIARIAFLREKLYDC